jgi:hypothetical protein
MFFRLKAISAVLREDRKSVEIRSYSKSRMQAGWKRSIGAANNCVLDKTPIPHFDNPVRIGCRIRIVGDHQNRLSQAAVQVFHQPQYGG